MIKKEDWEDFGKMEQQVLAAKDLPLDQRLAVFNHLLANFLNSRGALPANLKHLITEH